MQPHTMNWPETVAMLGMFACFALIAWAMSRDSAGEVVVFFRRHPEDPFEPSWKGKDQGRKAGDPLPGPTTTNDTTAAEGKKT